VLYAREGVRREAVALETPRCSAWSAVALGQAYSPPIWAYDCREPDGERRDVEFAASLPATLE
jgi:hypothetical protein